MITMVSCEIALIFFNVEIPSNLGIRISMRIKSKISFSISFNTSSPFGANDTLYPSFLSIISKNSLMLCSSSATNILSFNIFSLNLIGGQKDGKRGALSHLTIHFDDSVVIFNDFMNDRQTQPRPGFLGCKKRLENILF